MSNKAKKEYLEQIRKRYQSSGRKDKNKILDEFCKVCSYNRKYAIRLLNRNEETKPGRKRTGRPKVYNSPVIIHFLKILLRMTNLICSKRLKEAIPLWIVPYEKTYCVKISSANRNKLLNISASTIDRLVGKERRKLGKLGLSTTKPGSLIKKKVPIKTNQWDETRPGFMEADTVAHCGSSVSGSFVYTVNLVDIATGWVEARATWGKGQKSTFEAIRSIEAALPFKIKGFDSDNGAEFLNYHLMRYFINRKQPVEYTRSRPYQKNDNAHIEGKNWTHIRQYLGYERFDDPAIVGILNEMYSKNWSLFFNFFIPSSKLLEKQRQGSKIFKKHDKPKTPFQRLIESRSIPKYRRAELYRIQQTLNPFELQSDIFAKINEVLDLCSR